MDIKITKVNDKIIKEIDKRANKISIRTGKLFSRNQYIKYLIENNLNFIEPSISEDNYDRSISNLIWTMENQKNTLNEFIRSNNRIFYLIANDIDSSEWSEYLWLKNFENKSYLLISK